MARSYDSWKCTPDDYWEDEEQQEQEPDFELEEDGPTDEEIDFAQNDYEHKVYRMGKYEQ